MKSSMIDVSKIKPGISLDELTEITMKNVQILEKAYPEDIPNKQCNTAVFSGVLYQSEEPLENGYFDRLLSTNYEEVYIWKAEHSYAYLVSKVNSKVKDLDIWKTCGLMISISFVWSKGFEHSTDNIGYNWVYRFDKNQEKSELDFYENDSIFEIDNGVCISNRDLVNMIRLIALLEKDDALFNSIINFHSSMQLCYTCLICELSDRAYKMHPSHEPRLWEKMPLYNNFETAIVLACKSVENILGKPPRKDNPGSVEKFKCKWLKQLEINPDDQFEKGECSYFDFYYRLFSLRNDSAHANYKEAFDLERRNTIESQCFAAILLFDYINKNLPSFEDSSALLKLNTTLIQNEYQT